LEKKVKPHSVFTGNTRLGMSDQKEMIRFWSRARLSFKPKERTDKEAIAKQINTIQKF
jgi:hypothetical protein